MRFLIAALVVLAVPQDKVDCRFEMKKFDGYGVALRTTTKAESSDGRSYDYTFSAEFRYETEKSEGGVIHMNAGLRWLKASGTWRGREFTYDWTREKGAKSTGFKLPDAVATVCEKGFKIRLGERGALLGTDGLTDFLEVFPVWNPQALVGLATPFDPEGKLVWKSKGNAYECCGRFQGDFQSAVGLAKDDQVTLSTMVKLKPVDSEVPIEGAMTVAGEGEGKAVFDVKAKRPVSGDFTAKVHVAQGGWKRDYEQSGTFEVKP